MGRIANWFAVAWTAAVGVYLLYAPMYATETTSYSIGGSAPPAPTTHSGTTSLLAVEGRGAYVRALLPVVVALVPLLLPSRAARRTGLVVATILLLVYALLGAASIGLWYMPAVVALVVATMTDIAKPTVRPAV